MAPERSSLNRQEPFRAEAVRTTPAEFGYTDGWEIGSGRGLTTQPQAYPFSGSRGTAEFLDVVSCDSLSRIIHDEHDAALTFFKI